MTYTDTPNTPISYPAYLMLVKHLFIVNNFLWICTAESQAYHQTLQEDHSKRFRKEMDTLLKDHMFITNEGNIPYKAHRAYRIYILNFMIGRSMLELDKETNNGHAQTT